ncbi:MAG: serine/threonine protein phosphatase [Clostridiales bacterium]|nr:serine/threonine protein phosphatase [Clostridiales bacterium]
MRTFIIGDIHGHDAKLAALLEKMRPDPRTDALILLGDLFDRGPDAWAVFRRVQALEEAFRERFTLLMGNHEDYLLSETKSLAMELTWIRQGKLASVRSFRANGADMKDCRLWFRQHCRTYVCGEGFQCAHAGVRVVPIEANDRDTLVHDHGCVFENLYAGPLTVTGHVAVDAPCWFTGDGQTVERLPYGLWRPLPDRGVVCIDTGCGKGGWLTGMRIEATDGAPSFLLYRAE